MEPVENGSAVPAIMIAVAVLSVGTACFVGIGKWTTPQPASAIVQPMDRAPAVPQFQLGEIVKVKSSCDTFTLAATTEVAATAERLLLAGDVDGFGELLEANLVYGGEPDDRLRIIGFDPDPQATRRLGSRKTWIQARYTSGIYQGRAGWADSDALTR